MKEAAVSILSRAVELDQAKRFTEALLLYQEGIQMLINLRKGESGERANYYLKKIEEYMNRAETIKKTVDELKQQGKYHEQMNIKSDTTGHSYIKVFGRFLDTDVTSVTIEDPYIRAYHQVTNLIRFTEVLIKCCNNIKKIKLITIQNDREQEQLLNSVQRDLKEHYSIDLLLEYSPTLHDNNNDKYL